MVESHPVRAEPFGRLRAGLSKHEPNIVLTGPFEIASFDKLRTGFDRLRANGLFC